MAILLGPDGSELLGADGAVLTDGRTDDQISTLDVNATVISQYANSPVIQGLIETFFDAADQTANVNAFYDYVWNIQTAQGYGLDVWGRIVGVGRVLTLPPEGDFGFSEGQDYSTFGQGSFYSSSFGTLNYPISDDDYRTLILVKAAANISGCAAPSLNILLSKLFPGVRAYVVDNGGMTATYVFETPLTPVQWAILTQSGAVPRPAGVKLNFFQFEGGKRFGFGEGGFAPFGTGTFFGEPTSAAS